MMPIKLDTHNSLKIMRLDIASITPNFWHKFCYNFTMMKTANTYCMSKTIKNKSKGGEL